MLRPETEQIWNYLKDQPALVGFVLVGGSALAHHLRHRFSEDLDFAFLEDRLPRARLDALRRRANEAGVEFEPHDDPGALHEFAQGGLDLLDYQQDFIAKRTVKISFFAPDHPVRAVLENRSEPAGPRLATLKELFKTKSLLTASRTRTRDWYDLHILMSQCGYSLADYHQAFREAGIADQAAIGLQRLCSETSTVSDEGFEQLAPQAPSISELQNFFRTQRDAFERSAAAQSWRATHGR